MPTVVKSYGTLAAISALASVGWLVIAIGRFREGRDGTGTVDLILCLLFAVGAAFTWRRWSARRA